VWRWRTVSLREHIGACQLQNFQLERYGGLLGGQAKCLFILRICRACVSPLEGPSGRILARTFACPRTAQCVCVLLYAGGVMCQAIVEIKFDDHLREFAAAIETAPLCC